MKTQGFGGTGFRQALFCWELRMTGGREGLCGGHQALPTVCLRLGLDELSAAFVWAGSYLPLINLSIKKCLTYYAVVFYIVAAVKISSLIA